MSTINYTYFLYSLIFSIFSLVLFCMKRVEKNRKWKENPRCLFSISIFCIYLQRGDFTTFDKKICISSNFGEIIVH